MTSHSTDSVSSSTEVSTSSSGAALLITVTELLSIERSILGGNGGGGWTDSIVSGITLDSCNRAGMAGGMLLLLVPLTIDVLVFPVLPELPVYIGEMAFTPGGTYVGVMGEIPTAAIMREDEPKF